MNLKFCLLHALLFLLPFTHGFAKPMPIGNNFWNIKWHDSKDVFADGWESVRGENPWNPQFLEEVEVYACLRFMDWGEVNNSKRSRFAERTLKSDSRQSPVAYEWMIDLCNRVQADLWVCIPHLADADYSEQLAYLIRYGSDAQGQPYRSPQDRPVHAPLDANLKVYVEYSNETWNGMFEQAKDAERRGVELGLPGDTARQQGFAYHAMMAFRHFGSFEKVFGSDSPRVVKTLAGQTTNPEVLRVHLVAMEDPKLNPLGIRADAFALAPYFAHKVIGSDPDAFVRIRADMEKVFQRTAEQARMLQGTGLDLIAYEGGQHLTTHADQVNGDSEMYGVYMDYLRGMETWFTGVFVHYAHVGQMKPGGAWGALERTGQPIESAPRYRALVDYIRSGERDGSGK